MREKQRGTVSSNSRSQIVQCQRYSANPSSLLPSCAGLFPPAALQRFAGSLAARRRYGGKRAAEGPLGNPGRRVAERRARTRRAHYVDREASLTNISGVAEKGKGPMLPGVRSVCPRCGRWPRTRLLSVYGL